MERIPLPQPTSNTFGVLFSGVYSARLKKGGYFITSGIIDFKEDQVKEAIEKAGLTVVEINHQGEWVNITAQKR